MHICVGVFQSLCCIDKKGILSWANPSAEKVFFFSSSAKECMKLDMTEMGDARDVAVTESYIKVPDTKRKRPKKFSSKFLLECLLSSESECLFVVGIHFVSP